VLVNYIREAQIAAGLPRQQVYDFTMYILAGLLILGFIANALVTPLAECWFGNADPRTTNPESRTPNPGDAQPFSVRTALAWTAVGLPLAWGTWVTVDQAIVLFSGGR
jgi:hypothetical protein